MVAGRFGPPLPEMSQSPTQIERWSDRITKTLSYVSALGIFALMALVFVSVFFRYILNAPILATEDMMAVLLGVTIFTAVPGVTSSRGHITVELFVAPFRRVPALDRARKVLIDLGVIAMTAYMTYLMYLQASRQFNRETLSLVMEWPLWPATAGFTVLILIGGVLFAVRAFRDKGHAQSHGGFDL